MSKHILITAIIVGICNGCPMGLGKNYQNKPTFFHNDFYAYNADKNIKTSKDASHIVAQKEIDTERRNS